jgi:DNA polymerase-3 subunit delta
MDAGRVEGFLRAPGAASVVLIFGPDQGLVAERAVALVKAVAGGTDDAFRYAEISEASRLLEDGAWSGCGMRGRGPPSRLRHCWGWGRRR